MPYPLRLQSLLIFWDQGYTPGGLPFTPTYDSHRLISLSYFYDSLQITPEHDGTKQAGQRRKITCYS